jgi:hypothetical protein
MGSKMIKVEFASSAGSTDLSEDAPLGICSKAQASAGLDKTFIISAANFLQTLLCLSTLMRIHASDSGKVRVYANLAEEKAQALNELMRPLLWNPA